MPINRERQSSFAGGEFAPGLYGRTDFTKYQAGCHTALNYFVTPYGTLANRPGTRFLHLFASEADSNHDTARLVPFVFSDTDTILMVFRHEELRFFKYDSDTGTVYPLNLSGSVDPVWIGGRLVYLQTPAQLSLVTPYQWDELPDLRFSQVGDVVTIVHKDHLPHELSRTSSDSSSWDFLPISFETATFPGLGDDNYAGTPYLDKGLGPGGLTGNEEAGDFPVADSTYPAREWRWKVTRVFRDSESKLYETRPHLVSKARQRLIRVWNPSQEYIIDTDYFVDPAGSTGAFLVYKAGTKYIYAATGGDTGDVSLGAVKIIPAGTDPVGGATNGSGVLYWTLVGTAPYGIDNLQNLSSVPSLISLYAVPAHYVTVTWTQWSLIHAGGTIPAPEDTLVETRVYRGRGDSFGLVGIVRGEDGSSFVDEGADPDFAVSPPSDSVSAFNVANADYPGVVTMYEGRRVFAATGTYPSQVWASAIEQYSNIDVKDISLDNDALNFELSSPRYEQIRAMVPRQQLIVLTDNSEWLVTGNGENQILTPSSISARMLSQHGCGSPYPLDVNGQVMFMQRKGTVPRAIGLHQSGGYQAFDISTISRHLFIGYTIKDWAFAEDPYSLVWMARSDGALLSCTWIPEHEMMAWTRHSIEGGTVLSVASVPEGTEDAVYMAVLRDNGVALERLASRNITDMRDAAFLDSHSLYDGRNTDATKTATVSEDTAAITAFADAGGGDVTVTSNGHGLSVGDQVIITGTTSYNGTFSVQAEDANTFAITATWVADDATGTWSRGTAFYDTVSLTIPDSEINGSDWSNEFVRLHVGTSSVTMQVLSKLSSNTYLARLLGPLPSALDGVSTAVWGSCIQSAYVSQLADDDVYVVADGYVSGPYYGNDNAAANGVESHAGIVDFTNGDEANVAEVVVCGLKYDCDFRSLNSVPEKGRKRIVRAVTVETDGLRGGSIGPSFDSLKPLRVRQVADEFGVPSLASDEHTEVLSTGWQQTGDFVYRHSQPVPVTILGITREIEYGGD